MAAPNASAATFPADFKSQLRVAQRQNIQQSMPRAMIGVLPPSLNARATLDDNSPSIGTLDHDAVFIRDQRRRRIERQIGEQVGLLPQNVRNEQLPEEYSTLEEDLQRGAEEQAALLRASQSGRDTRPTSALKQQLLQNTQKVGERVIQKAAEQATKELGKLGLNTATGITGATDGSSGTMAAFGFLIAGAWSLAGLVAAIFIPEKNASHIGQNVTNLAELRQNLTQQATKQLSEFLPRPGLTSAAKIAASFTLAYYAIISGFLLCIFILVIALLYQLYSPDLATKVSWGLQALWQWTRWPEVLDYVGF